MTTRIAFVNGKGGVGKTTCSMLFAAALLDANQPISMDDRDPQQSATNAAGIFGVPIGQHAAMVIVDTAPSITHPATLDAIRTADLVILVTTPSPLDLASTAATATLIQTERTGPTRLLFNLVQTNNRFFEGMAEIAKEIPFPVFQHFLIRRTAYQTAQLYGWRALPPQHRGEVLKVATEIAEVLQSANPTSSKPELQNIRK